MKSNENKHAINCPNCGAVITSPICPYCGTIHYDFANIDTDSYSYIRMKFGNNLIWFKARVDSIVISDQEDDSAVLYCDNYPFRPMISKRQVKISIDFVAVEDEETKVLFTKARKENGEDNC